jgi:hypothetical protein
MPSWFVRDHAGGGDRRPRDAAGDGADRCDAGDQKKT